MIASTITVTVALSGFVTGIAIGILICWAKLSPHSAIRLVADVYTTALRGIPELLVIYLLFFGGSAFVSQIAHLFSVEGFVSVPVFLSGMTALGLISGAYIAEVLRSAWKAVDLGQVEAGRAFGMSRVLLFRRVIAPIVLRYALPAMGNLWQLTLKESALISIVGLSELMRQATVASTATEKPFLFYGAASAFYLIITGFSSVIFSNAEKWSTRFVRRQ